MLLTRLIPQPALESALTFALDLAWPVVPGCDQGRHGRRCGREDCLTAPPHPASEHAPLAATRDAVTIRRWWRQGPNAPVLLAAGLAFDVLEIPAGRAEAALDAVRRSGFRLGPAVSTADGRALVWVRPGSRLQVEVRHGRSWPYDGIGLRCLGSGQFLGAPPFGGSTWLEPPPAVGPALLPRGVDLLPVVLPACR